MRQIVLLAISCMAIASCASAQLSATVAQPPKTYELYSWRESNGSWTFSVVPSPSGANISAAQVRKRKFLLKTLNDLNLKIASLPGGTKILWLDRIAGSGEHAKGNKNLSFPPMELTEKIQHYARSVDVQVDLLSSEKK
jgi:hypothetical protein